MKLTLFDLDGTLTPLDTEDEWTKLLGRRGWLDPSPQVAFNAAYHRGDLDLEAYFSWYAEVLGVRPVHELEPLRDELVRERMLPSVTPAARGWIAAAARDSDATLLVSASNLFLTEAIGRGLGCDATLGTRYATRDGRFTGERLGEPCFRAGKVRHVELWLAQRGVAPAALSQARFYSDSHNDLPLLEAVAEPIAVDPDPRLRRVAEARGWPILSLGPTD